MLGKSTGQTESNERGISPVIGVILMVAVTVVLAAVIGAFVFGLGDSMGTPTPNAELAFSDDGSGDITVTHDGGETLSTDNTNQLSVTGADAADVNWNTDVVDDSAGDGTTASVTGEIQSGEEIVTVANTSADDEISVVWEADGTSNALGSYTA